MAEVKTRATIQHRGDTAANWSTNNPVPLERELVLETDTNTFKIGDGVTAYNALPYASGPTGPQGEEGAFLSGGAMEDLGNFDFGFVRVTGATTPSVIGCTVTQVGTASSQQVTPANQLSDYLNRNPAIRLLGSTSAGQQTEMRVNNAGLHSSAEYHVTMRFRLQAALTGDERWFAGLAARADVAFTNVAIDTQTNAEKGMFGICRKDGSNNIHVVHTYGTPAPVTGNTPRAFIDLGATLDARDYQQAIELTLHCREGVATYKVRSIGPVGLWTGPLRSNSGIIVEGTVPVPVTNYLAMAPRIWLTNNTVAAARGFEYTTVAWRDG